ncbi:MAG: polysaccharide pyruvyl transferase family protein [Myxococcales bacterium]|nr:polysaccharide pyruvyl transferase family protein [Myxococcales bacterium]
MRNRRIGILTFHRALNYGAVLQAYALQQAISALDPALEVKIVDYRCPAIEKTRELGQAGYRRGLLLGTAIHWFHHPLQARRRQHFEAFLRDHCSLSAPLDREELDTLNEGFDVLVSGSDQVWNPALTHGDPSFFLDFAWPSLGRVAYAASYGVTALKSSQRAFTARHLASFSNDRACLSVREKSGADIVEDLIGRRPSVVLDPTLLLTQADWAKLSVHSPKEGQRPYVLIYNMVPTDHLIGFARTLARRTGCVLRLIGHGLRHPDIPHVRLPTPTEFIGLFQNAAYVVANSFHGISFALNFERPLFTEMTDATGKPNTRVRNLLEIAGLENRSLDEQGRFVGGVDATSRTNIDWASVRERLSAERARSLDFLRTALLGVGDR